MIVYRICNTYPPSHDPVDGKGSALRGGRWNRKGIAAVYTAASLALARSELARHVNLDTVPLGMKVYEIEIPNRDILILDELPADWDSNQDWINTQHLGSDHLLDPQVLAIQVPSVCDHRSFNLILNPGYTDFDEVKIVRDYEFRP